MIWITTLCLLALAVWLFFNALNERRWVETHSHDESVAADKGFIPSIDVLSRLERLPRGELSLQEENTRFARVVAKVREKGAPLGERLERRAAAARVDDPDAPYPSAADEPGLFGAVVARVHKGGAALDERIERRTAAGQDDDTNAAPGLFGSVVAKVGNTVQRIDERLERRMPHALGQEDGREGSSPRRAAPIDEEDTRFARVVAKIRERSEPFGERLERRTAAARVEDPDAPYPSAADEPGLFGSAVARLGGAAGRVDDQLEARAQRARAADTRSITEEDTLIGRASARFAQRQEGGNGLFERAVGTVSGWLDRLDRRIGRKLEDRPDGPDAPSGSADRGTAGTTRSGG